jgi:hypothetical protein
LAPEALTISAHCTRSACTSLSNCSGVLLAGSAPISNSRWRTSGARAARLIASDSFATISRGVALGTKTPYQTTTSMSTPDSFIVGTSGSRSARFGPVFASGRRRPDTTCWWIAGMLAKLMSTSPPISAVSDGAVPR